MSAHPPREERGEDKFFWKPSSNGCFSVSSAYQFISAGTQHHGDDIWRGLWRWQVPEKIKAFMWIFAHGKTHTSQLRFKRGIDDSARCPFGCSEDEDPMHLLRDCMNARERWASLIKPSLWGEFSSLQGMDWIRWNLKKEAGKDFTQKLEWKILFGYLCWDIWTDRCKRVFGEDLQDNQDNGLSTFFRACGDHSLLSRCKFYAGQRVSLQVDLNGRQDAIKLEVDGSVLNSGRSGCGGVIRTGNEQWIGGFSCKLTMVPPAIAEVIAIIHGLQICWNHGYKHVIVSTDCIEAINLVSRGCTDNYPFKDIADEARQLISRNWAISIQHTTRENNLLYVSQFGGKLLLL